MVGIGRHHAHTDYIHTQGIGQACEGGRHRLVAVHRQRRRVGRTAQVAAPAAEDPAGVGRGRQRDHGSRVVGGLVRVERHAARSDHTYPQCIGRLHKSGRDGFIAVDQQRCRVGRAAQIAAPTAESPAGGRHRGQGDNLAIGISSLVGTGCHSTRTNRVDAERIRLGCTALDNHVVDVPAFAVDRVIRTQAEAEADILAGIRAKIDHRVQPVLRVVATPGVEAGQRVAETGRNRPVIGVGLQTAGDLRPVRTAIRGNFEDAAVKTTDGGSLHMLVVPELQIRGANAHQGYRRGNQALVGNRGRVDGVHRVRGAVRARRGPGPGIARAAVRPTAQAALKVGAVDVRKGGAQAAGAA